MKEFEKREVEIASSETTVKEIDTAAVSLLNITLQNVGLNALTGLSVYVKTTEDAPYVPLGVDDDFNIASMFVYFCSPDLYQLESGSPGMLILNTGTFAGVKLALTSASGTAINFFGASHA